MAKKMRPGAEGGALGQQAAGLRRSAPGKRFVGERAAQSRQAKRQELERVVRMAEEDAAEKRLEHLREESVSTIVLELVVESFRLARAFALAPLRILDALRRVRAEGRS
jgi:hypothetical protein